MDLDGLLGEAGVALSVGAVVIALASGVASVLSARRSSGTLPRPNATTWLIVALALTTLVGLILASLQPHRSLLLSRNLMASLPAWAVLLGALFALRPRPVTIATSAMFLTALALGTHDELTDHQRPPIGKAAAALSQRWHVGDTILQSAYATGPPLDQDLAIHLNPQERASLLLTRNVGLKPFTESLRTGRPIFTVTPIAGYTIVPLSPPPELADQFTRTWWKSWPGLVTVDAVEWTPRSVR
jgi:hypothetical protein